MLQFTPEETLRLRMRVKTEPAILAYMEEKVREVRENFCVPKTGIATWQGFFVCPTHSTGLVFDITDPLHYACPIDGESFTGPPYEGAWWRVLNGRNSEACHFSALLYLLTGEERHLELSRRLLLDYAIYYPGYAVHGTIPYNNPGKANAQTLCDAMWIKGLMLGYDIIHDALNAEERTQIEEQLLRPCGEFLMQYRMNQLHNHEIIADSSVGMLGLLLEEPRFLNFALYAPYGLRDQLRKGVLKDGFWFEGTPSYHFFALEQYIQFELFARHTSHSFFKTPGFAEILKFPLRLLQPDGRLPLLNDAGSGHVGFSGTENIFELAYAQTGDPDFARILHKRYAGAPRDNVDAFFFGVPTLPSVSEPPLIDYHCAQANDDTQPCGSGLSTMHGPDGRFLLLKHAPFGGEHDHYDRLGLHFMGLGKYIAPDIGTCLYGAPLHYAYYKNTASHNTVCLDGANQPPENAQTLRYEHGEGYTLLDTRVHWDGRYHMPDSLTIPQWSEEAYRDAVMRRVVVWYGDFFVDLFAVTVPQTRTMDWTLHMRGQSLSAGTALPGPWSETGAGRFLHDVRQAGRTPGAPLCSVWDLGDACTLEVYTLTEDPCYYAAGPDNPSVSDLSYLIQRKTGTQALFVHVVCASRASAPVLRSVQGTHTQDSVALSIQRADGTVVAFHYSLGE